jgi:DNA polymerase-3 subunit gamma/tau
MEQFVVSARKYRPQTFNDVVGQKSDYQYFTECHRKQSPCSLCCSLVPGVVWKTTCAYFASQIINLIDQMKTLLLMFLTLLQ